MSSFSTSFDTFSVASCAACARPYTSPIFSSSSVSSAMLPGYPANGPGNKVRMITRGKSALLVLISILVVAAPAAAAPDPAYVSLGDSYAAGPLIPLQVPLFGCLKSNNNYANLTARNLGLTL